MPDRRTVAGMAMLLLAPLFAAGCGARAGENTAADPENSPMESTTMDPFTGTTPLQCGQPFTAPAPGQFTLSAQFPSSAQATDEIVPGTVDVTVATDVRGVGAQRADVFLVRDGVLVTLPVALDSLGVAWDLPAGATQSVPGEASLAACGPGGGHLTAGAYELYARVAVSQTEGSTVEAFGGPWALELL